MDPQIKKRRLHTVILYRVESKDGYGDIVYADPEDLQCYKEPRMRLIRNREGLQVTSEIQLYCDGLDFCKVDDLIEIGDRKYPIISVAGFDGLKPGTGTTVVYL